MKQAIPFLVYIFIVISTSIGALIFSVSADAPNAGSMVQLHVGDSGICSAVHIGRGNFLTAAHCVNDRLVIEDDRGARLDNPTVAWTSKTYDVALLKHDLAIGSIGDAPISCRELPVGELVHAAGNPLGKSFIHTWGRIAHGQQELSQPPPNPSWPSVVAVGIIGGGGMSGGPLYDKYDNVIGIIVAGYGFVVPTGSLMYAVPTTTICKIMVGVYG